MNVYVISEAQTEFPEGFDSTLYDIDVEAHLDENAAKAALAKWASRIGATEYEGGPGNGRAFRAVDGHYANVPRSPGDPVGQMINGSLFSQHHQRL